MSQRGERIAVIGSALIVALAVIAWVQFGTSEDSTPWQRSFEDARFVSLRTYEDRDHIDLVVVAFGSGETLSTAAIEGPNGNRHRGGRLAGKKVVVAFDRSVELYALDGEHIRTLFDLSGTEPDRAVTSHLVSPNGRSLAVTDTTGRESASSRLHIIDISNGRIRRTVSGDDLPATSPIVVRWSADGQLLHLVQRASDGQSAGDWLLPVSAGEDTTELKGEMSDGLTWRVKTEASATCLRRDGTTIRLSRRDGGPVAHTFELPAAEVVNTRWSEDDQFVFVYVHTWFEPRPEDCSNLDGPPNAGAEFVYSLRERNLVRITDVVSLTPVRERVPGPLLDSLDVPTDVVVRVLANSPVGLLYAD